MQCMPCVSYCIGYYTILYFHSTTMKLYDLHVPKEIDTLTITEQEILTEEYRKLIDKVNSLCFDFFDTKEWKKYNNNKWDSLLWFCSFSLQYMSWVWYYIKKEKWSRQAMLEILIDRMKNSYNTKEGMQYIINNL